MVGEMAILRQQPNAQRTHPRAILAADESKVQTGNLLRNRICSDGSIPWVRDVLLPAVSIKPMACLVHQRHCRLVHRKFPNHCGAGQKNIQGAGTGSRSGKSAQRRGKICPHQHSTCHLLESTFPVRRERDHPRQNPPQPRNPCGRFLVGFHRNLWLGRVPCKTRKGLRRDSCRNQFLPTTDTFRPTKPAFGLPR